MLLYFLPLDNFRLYPTCLLFLFVLYLLLHLHEPFEFHPLLDLFFVLSLFFLLSQFFQFLLLEFGQLSLLCDPVILILDLFAISNSLSFFNLPGVLPRILLLKPSFLLHIEGQVSFKQPFFDTLEALMSLSLPGSLAFPILLPSLQVLQFPLELQSSILFYGFDFAVSVLLPLMLLVFFQRVFIAPRG